MSDQLHVCFVCTGNICRSPMAQNIFQSALDDSGLGARVRVTSCGTTGWHTGEPADNRARTELLAHGYPDAHVASQLSPEHFDADLLVAMDAGHVRELERKRLGERVRLLRSFDPDADPDDLDLNDPYYGTGEDFEETREQIEAAIPGLLAWVHATLDGN
ncbi:MULTISPECIES: low molecular weight protein-tyrosine-phosphatase [Gordonia]|uniref:protein-tyrosine-phosphatase n=2 Tax=Gordonia TaxID=2053 RepID=A0A9X3D2L0_9ACTN|nr:MULTISPECIES: low molecular weight protein-tyrosine-phosphatase [Gordonia]MCF3938014.1 low molecular weight phosphotyrosine protein phosphatase [Gordonia tangerina]MCX2963798.1 low molecular weight phosphotyrosine protein phosphatase [Gordonia aquimaris]